MRLRKQNKLRQPIKSYTFLLVADNNILYDKASKRIFSYPQKTNYLIYIGKNMVQYQFEFKMLHINLNVIW